MKKLNLTINIPNILTIIRILLIPFFIISLLREMFSFALLVFTLAAVSDALDGLLARYFNQHTVLGAYLDPIADKLLLSSSFVCLAALRILPGWLAVIVITRDILIVLGIAIFTIADIKIEMKPIITSKLTTVSQIASVILVLFDPHFAGVVFLKRAVFWVTAALTIFSGFHYIYIGMNVIQEGSNNRPKK